MELNWKLSVFWEVFWNSRLFRGKNVPFFSWREVNFAEKTKETFLLLRSSKARGFNEFWFSERGRRVSHSISEI